MTDIFRNEKLNEILGKIRGFFKKSYAYFFVFFVPQIILFTAYAMFEVYPFGERSVLALDLNAQYVTYFDYLYDVFGGSQSLFYNWSGSLSEGFFGLFAYYLASPFNLIILMFPRDMITEGIMAMLLVKSGAVGLSACFFLKKHRGYSNYTAMLFSVMFALCGYFTAHTINPMWLDGLIALPLVLAGIERVVKERRFLLYSLSLLYIFIANYYIGYMVGIFSALYFVYYLCVCEKLRKFREYAAAVIIFTVASISSILMSGIMIIPAYKSLQNGKIEYNYTGDHFFEDNLAENFNIGDIFIKLFPATYDTERPDGLPMLYCGTLALIFAVIYFVMKKIPLRRRVGGGILLGILTLSMYIKPVDMLWHGGQVPVWMPYRYSFTIIFLLIVFGAEAFENIADVRRKQIGSAFAVLAVVLLMSDYYGGGEHFDTTLIIVVPLICLSAMTCVVLALRLSRRTIVLRIIAGAAVCFELFISCRSYLGSIHNDVYYSPRETYLGDIPFTRYAVQQVKEYDDGFYRMEKTFHRTVNDNMALGMYGVSHSTSTFNTRALQLLRDLGFGSRDHYSRYDGSTMLTDDILGIKYVLSKRQILTPYEKTIPIESKKGIKAFENSDALGIAFPADEGVIGCEISESSPFMFQQALASILAGEEQEIFKPVYDMIFDSSNVSIGSTTDYHASYKKRISNEDATITYNVLTSRGGAVYAYFPSSYERECGLYINDEYIKNYFESENHSIVYLGTYSAGEDFDVKLKLYKDDLYIINPEFYVIDSAALEAFTAKMRENYTEITKTSGSSLSIKVNAKDNCALFTSIPFEEGWTATIDGQAVEVLSGVNQTLLCVRVPAGEHTIELNYFPAGLKTGIILSVSGTALLVIMLIAASYVRKTRTSKK
ncbi:MAG: YfhO family protein [Oscillospiraceae bacterium]|nr:YfhO family protein [Oscillospiraceae bacterium]